MDQCKTVITHVGGNDADNGVDFISKKITNTDYTQYKMAHGE